LVDENPKAVNYISDLSDFMRYLLSTNEKDLVSLEEEIEISEKYIRLQKTRFGNSLHANFDINKKLHSKVLPPLVLQMLIENAIKHNVVSKDNELKIKIFEENEYLCVENNLNKKKSVNSTEKGLVNITNRYSLFTRNKIIISETENTFLVKVPLLILEK